MADREIPSALADVGEFRRFLWRTLLACIGMFAAFIVVADWIEFGVPDFADLIMMMSSMAIIVAIIVFVGYVAGFFTLIAGICAAIGIIALDIVAPMIMSDWHPSWVLSGSLLDWFWRTMVVLFAYAFRKQTPFGRHLAASG
jgi:uncharacterized membrane protein